MNLCQINGAMFQRYRETRSPVGLKFWAVILSLSSLDPIGSSWQNWFAFFLQSPKCSNTSGIQCNGLPHKYLSVCLSVSVALLICQIWLLIFSFTSSGEMKEVVPRQWEVSLLFLKTAMSYVYYSFPEQNSAYETQCMTAVGCLVSLWAHSFHL